MRMHSIWRALVGGIVLSCGISAGAQSNGDSATTVSTAPAAAVIPKVTPGTWVVLGSSTAKGAGAIRQWGWTARIGTLAALMGASLVNFARADASTYAALSASAPASVPNRPPIETDINIDAAAVFEPKLVILSFPSNDAAAGFSAEETVSNLLAIRQVAMARHATVMVLSSQPRKLTPEQTALQLRSDELLKAAVGPCFVDVRTPLVTPEGEMDMRWFARDGIHPNSTGHARIYVAMKEALAAGTCVRVPPLPPEPAPRESRPDEDS